MKTIQKKSEPVKAEFELEKSVKKTAKKISKYKQGTLELSETYLKTHLPWKNPWARMLKFCGSKLVFARHPKTGFLWLIAGKFCQKRLCPLCAWRRSIKIFRNVYRIITQPEFSKVEFIFLTLTVRNCTGKELPETLDRILSAWNLLTKDERQPFRHSFLGTFRALEITYDGDKVITKERYKKAKEYYDRRKLKVGDVNPNFNTYHPHFHVLAAVSPDYFEKSNQNYISFERLQEIWTDALNRAPRLQEEKTLRLLDTTTFGARLELGPKITKTSKKRREKFLAIDYFPEVRIEAVKETKADQVAEVAKYTVKPSDYLDRAEVVEVLDQALRHRRLVAYGGLFKEVRDKLGIEEGDEDIAESDIEKDDISLSDIMSNPLIEKIIMTWQFGANFFRIERHKKKMSLAEEVLKELEELEKLDEI